MYSEFHLGYDLGVSADWDSVACQYGFHIRPGEPRRVVIQRDFIERRRNLQARDSVSGVRVGDVGQIVVRERAKKIIMQSDFRHARKSG